MKPDNPGNLAHTKVVSATIDGVEFNRPRWNGVREHMHVIGMKRLGAPICLTIEWREKEGAAHPGKTAVLKWRRQGVTVCSRRVRLPHQ